MTILITGATGLVGQSIVNQALLKGYNIHYLTTSKRKIKSLKNYKGYYWNPKEGIVDENAFTGVDAIINLAGASISKRWTDNYKKELLNSRIDSLRTLRLCLDKNNINVKNFISASAIGIYSSSEINYYSEDEKTFASSFLGDIVEQWEQEINLLKPFTDNLSIIRVGLVLSKNGGAFPKVISPIKLGAGAAFGNGKQWQSWIHVEDLASLFLFGIEHNLNGIYNGVAPNPVTNHQLTKITAKALKRPLLLPNIPRFVMKIVLGEMHMLLFESQRVSAQKIISKGFNFKFPNLELAVGNILKN